MIVLVTDFGLTGPYVGQMAAVIHQNAPGVAVLNLFSDAPVHNPRATAYLLPAFSCDFPPDTVFLCVVDPGVGSGVHEPTILRVNDQWFVGPNNGLFNVLAKRAGAVKAWTISWAPERVSSTFHGRDLYAPVAARLARGELPPGDPAACPAGEDWPDDLYETIYIDHFGNAMTGVRARVLARDCTLSVKGRALTSARTFAEVPIGVAFWYENANGLVEIAVNQGRADGLLGLQIGDPVTVAR